MFSVRYDLRFLYVHRTANKLTVSSVMPVRPSVHMEQLCCYWTDLHEIDTWVFFENLSRKLKFNYSHVTRKPKYTFDHISLSSFRATNFEEKICMENQNTHFKFSIFFEIVIVCKTMWKNVLNREDTDENMAHAHCMLDT